MDRQAVVESCLINGRPKFDCLDFTHDYVMIPWR
jgi:hypothetical protein